MNSGGRFRHKDTARLRRNRTAWAMERATLAKAVLPNSVVRSLAEVVAQRGNSQNEVPLPLGEGARRAGEGGYATNCVVLALTRRFAPPSPGGRGTSLQHGSFRNGPCQGGEFRAVHLCAFVSLCFKKRGG